MCVRVGPKLARRAAGAAAHPLCQGCQQANRSAQLLLRQKRRAPHSLVKGHVSDAGLQVVVQLPSQQQLAAATGLPLQRAVGALEQGL